MKAGRDLDELVAKEVMGWKETFLGNGYAYWEQEDGDDVRWIPSASFRPSERIEDAISAIVVLRGSEPHMRGPWIAIEFDGTADLAPACIVTVKRDREVIFQKDTSYDHLPYTICMAVLTSKGIEVGI